MKREDIDKIIDEYLSEYHKRIIKEEIERLNNIISNMEEELMLLYLDFVEFNVEKAKEEINKLKGVDKE